MEKEYVIPVSWKVVGEMRIQANSLEEAIEKAYESHSLPDGAYVEDSFEVDVERMDGERNGA